MVNLQSEFIEFHNAIKLSFDDNAELREKRDILLNRLCNNISEEAPSFDHFNQGSYAMHTGIKPDDGDYDIDVGLVFDLIRTECPDPLKVKQWVFDALDGHTKKVEIRRSCVTVTYQKDGELAFHVDFACYANEDDTLFIGKGRKEQNRSERNWEQSAPKELIKLMDTRFSNEQDRAQFRRIIRYMKKWRNQHFEVNTGNGAPTGIALTALAYDKYVPNYKYNAVTHETVYDDFGALKDFVIKTKDSFTLKYDLDSKSFYHGIEQQLFVTPRNNLFDKMTAKQQDNVYNEICNMLAKLEEVEGKTRKSEACSLMVEIFGEEFPVKTDRSYVGHSESA